MNQEKTSWAETRGPSIWVTIRRSLKRSFWRNCQMFVWILLLLENKTYSTVIINLTNGIISLFLFNSISHFQIKNSSVIHIDNMGQRKIITKPPVASLQTETPLNMLNTVQQSINYCKVKLFKHSEQLSSNITCKWTNEEIL